MPVPEPEPHEILIALRTAGIGSWDASIRDGSWKPPGRTKFPLIPGTDGSGIVVRAGSRVTRFRRGDRVYAYEFGNPQGGFYAEFAAVSARHAARIPKGLSLAQAGAVAATGLTACRAVDALKLRAGQTVVVFGASGAVGTIALQFARWRGARVIATATGSRAQQTVRRLGAEAAVDIRSRAGMDRLKALAPDGVDAVLAFAGGEALERVLELVRPGSRVVYPNGIEPAPRHRGRLRIQDIDAEASPREFARLSRWATAARLRVPIAGVYSLRQAATAHRKLEHGRIVGRLVLAIKGSRR